jgi:peptidoglycan hydrolase-like protein with peptidoglycan-binding domain
LIVPATAAFAATPAPLPIGSTVLGPGAQGPGVRTLQGDLWQVGFNPGVVNGTFDARTKRALLAYQASRHLARTGVLDVATMHRLLIDLRLTATAPLPIGSTVLAPGDEGPAVRVLQGDLWQFGFDPGVVTGTFDAKTAGALEAYQASRGLPQTGTLDAPTFARFLVDLHLAPTTTGSSTGKSGSSTGSSGSSTGKSGSSTGKSGSSTGKSGSSTGKSGSSTGKSGSSTGSSGSSTGKSGSSTGSSGSSTGSSGSSTGKSGSSTGKSGSSTGSTGSSTGKSTGGGTSSKSPEILAYWAVYGGTGPLSDLTSHASQITWLSPYWYTLTGSAGLNSHESNHAQVDSTSTGAGVPVVPLINQGSGVTQLIATASGRARASQAIASLVRSNADFRGVVIDFELLPASSRNNFTAFIQTLRQTLPTSDVVGVAVMPKSSSPGPSYAQVFNYKALGQTANFIQIMTYDRHSSGTVAGPISPNNWVQSVAKYAASVIPPQKILLGVPGYGYNWVGTSATTVTDVQAAALAANRGITPTYNATYGEYHFSYTSGGVLHTVWYEAPQGIAAKDAIVRQYGLGGLALWTLGGEQPSFWTAINGG